MKQGRDGGGFQAWLGKDSACNGLTSTCTYFIMT